MGEFTMADSGMDTRVDRNYLQVESSTTAAYSQGANLVGLNRLPAGPAGGVCHPNNHHYACQHERYCFCQHTARVEELEGL